MSRIHPAAHKNSQELEAPGEEAVPVMLTVWKRSSMSFQGTDGFTVFDRNGRLAFRVDSYSRKRHRGALVLMDGAGNPLLSLKPQISFRMHNQWHAYKGESGCGKAPTTTSKVFTIMKSHSFFQSSSKTEGDAAAVVFMTTQSKQEGRPDFKVEGSFWRRNCKIKTIDGQLVAKIARKRVNSTILLDDDVFNLIIQPDFQVELIMAFVIILDRISAKPFVPHLCS